MIFLIYIFITCCTIVIGGTGVGQVVINETSEIIVREGQAGILRVYINLFNETTDLPTGEYDSDVVVSCELSTTEIGYSAVNFTSSVNSNPQGTESIDTTVNYTAATAGRETTVTCWGESTDVNSTQFRKETSVSVPLSVQITAKGRVSICDDLVVVPYTQGEFLLELNQIVQDSNVTVQCNTSSALGSMELQIPDTTVLPGDKKIRINYEIVSIGEGVFVQCGAESASGDQFVLPDSYSDPVLFVLDEGSVRMYPDRQVFNTNEMQVFLVLDDILLSEELTFTCSVDVANTTEDALDITNNPYCAPSQTQNSGNSSTTTTPRPSNDTTTTTSSGDWFLTDVPCDELGETTDFIFDQEENLYKLIRVCRKSSVTRRTQEFVVVTCCAPRVDGLNPKYVNISTAVLNTAQLAPLTSYSMENIPEVGSATSETTFPNPAWVELAPCPCDLTVGSCDLRCCCDPDCSTSDEAVFESCIEGVAGGGSGPVPDTYCDTTYFNPPDWFQFLCVHRANSAYLGRYYESKAIVAETSFDVVAGAYRSENTYAEDEDRDAVDEAADGTYSDGEAVKTALPRPVVGEDYFTGDSYRLTLPTRMASGGCVWSSPVRYLRDSSSQCVETLTSDMCSTESRLNARLYVESTSVQDASCPKTIVVLAEDGSEIPVETNTNYLCLDANKQQSYVPETTTWEEIYTDSARYAFAYDLSGNGSSCTFNENGIFSCDLVQNNDSAVFEDTYVPSRCCWDNGYTPAPEPFLNVNNNTCDNAVVDVHYTFTWRNQRITKLEATVILGDIPLTVPNTGDATILTQNYQVTFYNTLENTTANGLPFERSGNPGYEVDKPVISGVALTDNDTLLYVDTNLTNSLNLWAPTSDGLCFNAGQSVIAFGQNSISSCILRLSLDDLTDCQLLRYYVLSQQESIMDATYISMVGNPNSSSLDDYIQILRENITGIISMTEDDTDSTPVTTESTPGDTTTTQPITEPSPNSTSTLNPVTTDPSVNSTGPTYADLVTGRCHNIPSGIHVDILYAEAGIYNNTVINRIVGAKVSYTFITWSMECSGADGTLCYSNDTTVDGAQHVQSFLVTSSATFTKVPAIEPVPQTRYQEEHTPELPVCRYETCWDELFYPLRSFYTGEPGGYGVAVAMAGTFFIVGLFMISRPWW